MDLRRIVGITVAKCIKINIKVLGGDQHLCMGQKRGIEYAIHSLRAAFKNTDSEAILLIDPRTLLIVSTVILPFETSGNYALLFIIP